MGNTGFKRFSTLEEYYLDDNSGTGVSKANDINDVDYIAPVYDPSSCIPDPRFYNQLRTASANKNNCGPGYSGSSVVLTAMEGQFFSNISLDDANNKADVWLAANKQSHANIVGVCTPALAVQTRIWFCATSASTGHFATVDIVHQAKTNDVNSVNSMLVYTDGIFTEGKVMYTDSNLTFLFTLKGYVTDGNLLYVLRPENNIIYNDFLRGVALSSINSFSFVFSLFADGNTTCSGAGQPIFGFSQESDSLNGWPLAYEFDPLNPDHLYLNVYPMWYEYMSNYGFVNGDFCKRDNRIDLETSYGGPGSYVSILATSEYPVDSYVTIKIKYVGDITNNYNDFEVVILPGHLSGSTSGYLDNLVYPDLAIEIIEEFTPTDDERYYYYLNHL